MLVESGKLNQSLQTQMNQSVNLQELSADQSTLLVRCKDTIEDLQFQVNHLSRSKEILEEQLNTLRGIIIQKDRRLEQLQARVISLTINNQKEDALHQFAGLSAENQRISKALNEARQQIAKMRDQSKRISDMNMMLLSDKKLLTDIIRQKENEVVGLHHSRSVLQGRIEDYKVSIRKVEQLYEKEMTHLRNLLEKSRQVSRNGQDPDDILRGSNKHNRGLSLTAKSKITRNSPIVRIGSIGKSRQYKLRLDTTKQDYEGRQMGCITRKGSAQYRSQTSLSREVADIYGIVHNNRKEGFDGRV